MANLISGLPPEIRLQVTDLLDPPSAARAALAGSWILSCTKKNEIDRARPWGTIFKPDTNWGDLLAIFSRSGFTIQDILLIGTDIKYIRRGGQRPKDRDILHIALVVLGEQQDELLYPRGLLANLRDHTTIPRGVYIPKFNIAVHFATPPTFRSLEGPSLQLRLDLQELWNIGQKRTQILSFHDATTRVINIQPIFRNVKDWTRYGCTAIPAVEYSIQITDSCQNKRVATFVGTERFDSRQ